MSTDRMTRLLAQEIFYRIGSGPGKVESETDFYLTVISENANTGKARYSLEHTDPNFEPTARVYEISIKEVRK